MQPYHLPLKTLFFVNKKAACEIINNPDGGCAGGPFWQALAYGKINDYYGRTQFYQVAYLDKDGAPCYIGDDGESFEIIDGALDVRADTTRARLLSWCAEKLGASYGPWGQAYGLHCSAWALGYWKLQSTDGMVYSLPWLKSPSPTSGYEGFIAAVAAATVELVFKISIMEELGLPVEL